MGGAQQTRQHCVSVNERQALRVLLVIDNYDSFTYNLQDYFSNIRYRIERGNNFFYFSKMDEAPSLVEKKLETFEKYIDIIDLFASMDNKITIGSRFRPSEIASTAIGMEAETVRPAFKAR